MVMKATDLGKLDHRPRLAWVNRSLAGCVHVERLVNAPSVVVAEVTEQDFLQMPLLSTTTISAFGFRRMTA